MAAGTPGRVLAARPAPARRAAGPAHGLAAIAAILAALFAGSPLAAGFYDFETWGTLALALFTLLVGTLLGTRVAVSRWAAAGVGALVALAAWSALSTTWAESGDRAWTEANRFALYAAVLAGVVLTVRTAAAARLVAGVLAASVGMLVAFLAVRLTLGGPELFVDHRLSEPLGYVNGLAGFIIIGLWALVAAAESRLPAVVRGGAVVLAVLAVDVIVLTQSRAILPALTVSAAVVFAFVPGRRLRGWVLLTVAAGVAPALPDLLGVYAGRIDARALPVPEALRSAMSTAWLGALGAGTLWAVACARAARLPARVAQLSAPVLLAVVVALGIAAVAAVDRPLERGRAELRDFTSLRFDAGRDTRFASAGGNRYDLWRIALGQFAAQPVRGVGAGNYATTYFLERRSPDDDVRQPHSLGLQVLAELGLVGGVALAVFLGVVLLAGVRPPPWTLAGGDGLVRVAALGGFAAWLAHTSVDWLHNLPGVTGMALVGAGLLLAGTPPPRPGSGGDRRRRAAAGLAVIVVLIAAASTGRQLAAVESRQAAAGLLDRDPAAALARAERAVAFNPRALEGHYVRAAAHARLGDYRAARAALRRAAAHEPRNHVPWALLGDLATRRGDAALARRCYGRAHALNPRDVALAALAGKTRTALAGKTRTDGSC